MVYGMPTFHTDVQKISDLKATTTNYDKALVRFFEQAQKDAPMLRKRQSI